MFDREEIPETKEKKTRGTTISNNKFLKICPPKLNKYFSVVKKIEVGIEF